MLSKRRNLASLERIRIQPDLSPQDRITLSVLLKERRKLIDQDSVDRQQIRIRGDSNGKKHGNADGPSFSPVNSPPQHQSSEETNQDILGMATVGDEIFQPDSNVEPPGTGQ